MSAKNLSTFKDETSGRWWRFTDYEVTQGYIKPAADATLDYYDPWGEFESVDALRRQGGRSIDRPYLSLQDISSAFDLSESHGFAHINPDKWPILTEWCKKHGPLGLFFIEARQIDLYPRWDSRLLSTEVEGSSWPSTTSCVRTPTGWFRQQLSHLGNAEVFSVPLEEKPQGGIVPRKFWPADASEPGVITQDEKGRLKRVPLGSFMPQFFPSIAEPETHIYPTPLSDDFWKDYSENVVRFLYAANQFNSMMRTLARMKPFLEMTEFEKHEVISARQHLLYLSSQVNPSIGFNADGTSFRDTVCTSLLASFAMMVLLDSTREMLRVCDKCDRVFVSTVERARFCSTRCRNAVMQQERRTRVKREQGFRVPLRSPIGPPDPETDQ